MSPRITIATARRIVQQLRNDPRTIALLLIVPALLLALVKWVYLGRDPTFQRVGVPLLGIFPLVSMFLVTSIGMLRERTTGTLERLMAMRVGKLDLLLGYGIAFGAIAVAQAAIVSAVAFGPLGLETSGPVAAVVLFAVLNAVLGSALGLFASALARTEFQAVQFMPAFLLPQLLLSGLLAPRDTMARELEIVSDFLPMTYAYDALRRVADDDIGERLALDAAVLVCAAAAALALGAATLRRRTE